MCRDTWATVRACECARRTGDDNDASRLLCVCFGTRARAPCRARELIHRCLRSCALALVSASGARSSQTPR